MSEWKLKRFWKDAAAAKADGGYAIELDGRPVRSPAKTPLVVPRRPLAEAVAAEWAAQDKDIDPETMPFTRLANSAIDKVAVQHGAVASMLAEYGGSDLLCYRADGPAGLIDRQTAAWDPLLGWAADHLGVRLAVQAGIMPVAQDASSLARIETLTAALNPFHLTAFHELVTLSGSWVIAYAALEGVQAPEALWACSRIDETWQAEQWGRDEEAEELAAVKQEAFLTGYRFYQLSS